MTTNAENGGEKDKMAIVLPLVDISKTADPKWWPGTKSKVKTYVLYKPLDYMEKNNT